MKYSLLFLPEVEDDVVNGYVWYEQKTRGLGGEFLRMFYARAQEIPRKTLKSGSRTITMIIRTLP